MKRQLVPLALALVTLASGTALAAQPTEISVNGSGTVSMMPDQATVNAQLQTNADTSSAAVDQNNRRYNAIVEALTKDGIARDDITLSYYNMNYVPKPPNPAPNDRYGYTITRSFAIKVRRIDRAGSVVDAATAAGATSIDSVEFGLAHPAIARTQATQLAVADARAKAAEVAKAAGLRIEAIKTIALEGGPGIVRPLMKSAVTADTYQTAPTQFDSGTVTVSVNVSVVFSATP